MTGAISGLVVVDVDGDEGWCSLQSLALDSAVSTPVAKTGRGAHMYYKHPGHRIGNSAGKIKPGIDIRGDGGYIIAPPSKHKNGRLYDWVAGSELRPIGGSIVRRRVEASVPL